MPRARSNTGSSEPKRRSRTGCWPCKERKVKCGEEKPACENCVKQGVKCDYNIRLNWGGRARNGRETGFVTFDTQSSAPPSTPSFRTAALSFPSSNRSPLGPPSPTTRYDRSGDSVTSPTGPILDPRLAASARHDAPAPPAGVYWPLSVGDGAVQPQAGLTPYSNIRSEDRSDFSWSAQHGKRIRLDEPGDPRMRLPRPKFAKPPLPGSFPSPYLASDQDLPAFGPFANHDLSRRLLTPSTPGSSNPSEDTAARAAAHHRGHSMGESTDLRRLSVSSLLSGPPGLGNGFRARSESMSQYPRRAGDGNTLYGFDYGHPDMDMPHNDDAHAIVPRTPAVSRVQTASSDFDTVPSDGASPESVEPQQAKDMAFGSGGYYAKPVPVTISKKLEPLPSYLTDNPMNLLYFHHFLNHTARILIPHDCPNNPYRSTLPYMAVRNANLLNLLLAYSAAHRARLLDHPEPRTRIASWVQEFFPDLRAALSAPEPVSDATLASAIMLASLEIISPNTFEYPIQWQDHLHIAREIIVSRGGLSALSNTDDEHLAFLCKWYAYLEIVGSLSGNKSGRAPLSGDYWHSTDANKLKIDCFLGFTTRCVSLLGQVASLSQLCDAERMDEQGNIDPSWEPSPETREAAEKIRVALESSKEHVHEGCVHYNSPAEPTVDKSPQDAQEIYRTNEMFHWAGLIHLHRRVLAKHTRDPDVQDKVREIVEALKLVRKGSSTESCLLFPMFTAGCDAVDEEQRECISERLQGVEGWGMTHVLKARRLMQTVWDTGKPWETLVTGEFFG